MEPQNHLTIITNYETIKVLGQGGQGEAILVKNKIDNLNYVLKKYLLQNNKYETELKILKKLSNANVVKYFAYFFTEFHLNLVLEYCDYGTLEGQIQTQLHKNQLPLQKLNQQFPMYLLYPEKIVKNVAFQLLNALMYIHQNRIVHRDVKPENILLKKQNNHFKFLLCDFGISKENHQQQLNKTQIGTFYYLSPQILQNQHYNQKTDLWALGVLLHKMLFGVLPFGALDDIGGIVQCIIKYQYKYIICLSPEMNQMLQNMLIVDQSQRMDAQQLLQLPLFNSSVTITSNADYLKSLDQKRGYGGKVENVIQQLNCQVQKKAFECEIENNENIQNATILKKLYYYLF